VKKKKRRTTDLEKESTEDVEEESRGGRSGNRKEAGSECDGGNTKEGRRGNAKQQCGWL